MTVFINIYWKYVYNYLCLNNLCSNKYFIITYMLQIPWWCMFWHVKNCKYMLNKAKVLEKYADIRNVRN